MLTTATFLVASAVAGFQLATSTPLRVGPVAEGLSPSDVAEIVELTRQRGRTIWLVIGFPSMVVGQARLTVYLEPETETRQLRRGARLVLVGTESQSPGRSDWSVKSTSAYAHVLQPGRAPGELRDHFDTGRPFAIEGELDDTAILELVTFIRSSPAIPGVPVGQAPRQVAGDCPISFISRKGEKFIVGLSIDGATGQDVTVTRAGARWVIMKVSGWIV